MPLLLRCHFTSVPIGGIVTRFDCKYNSYVQSKLGVKLWANQRIFSYFNQLTAGKKLIWLIFRSNLTILRTTQTIMNDIWRITVMTYNFADSSFASLSVNSFATVLTLLSGNEPITNLTIHKKTCKIELVEWRYVKMSDAESRRSWFNSHTRKFILQVHVSTSCYTHTIMHLFTIEKIILRWKGKV